MWLLFPVTPPTTRFDFLEDLLGRRQEDRRSGGWGQRESRCETLVVIKRLVGVAEWAERRG